MAYEPKPGSFSLFKNDRKEKETHPDYKGDGMSLDGKPIWVSAWLKESNGKKFMSCSIQFKDSEAAKPEEKKPAKTTELDDSIPF